MEWLVYIMICVTIIALAGITLGYFEGRRKHKLELQREERLLIEARTKQMEAENQRADLEYRKAVAELEQFDRRRDTPPGPSTT